MTSLQEWRDYRRPSRTWMLWWICGLLLFNMFLQANNQEKQISISDQQLRINAQQTIELQNLRERVTRLETK